MGLFRKKYKQIENPVPLQQIYPPAILPQPIQLNPLQLPQIQTITNPQNEALKELKAHFVNLADSIVKIVEWIESKIAK